MKNTVGRTLLDSDEASNSGYNAEELLRPNVDRPTSNRSRAPISGIIIGLLVDFDKASEPMVDFFYDECGYLTAARSIVVLTRNDVGREVVLQFEQGDVRKPVVMGLVQQSQIDSPQARRERTANKADPSHFDRMDNLGTSDEKPAVAHPSRTPSEGAQSDNPRRLALGLLVGIAETGDPLVDFPGNLSGCLITARTIVPVTSTDVEREVLLLFESDDSTQPILLGILQLPRFRSDAGVSELRDSPPAPEEHCETLTFAASREIVFRCGSASLTLTCDGKVTIKGSYLLSRSTGVNRINGASVQIN